VNEGRDTVHMYVLLQYILSESDFFPFGCGTSTIKHDQRRGDSHGLAGAEGTATRHLLLLPLGEEIFWAVFMRFYCINNTALGKKRKKKHSWGTRMAFQQNNNQWKTKTTISCSDRGPRGFTLHPKTQFDGRSAVAVLKN